MAKTIDARGLSCPQPVLITLDEVKNGNEEALTVLVDNAAAKENVSRAAQSRGWKVAEIAENEGVFSLEIVKG